MGKDGEPDSPLLKSVRSKLGGVASDKPYRGNNQDSYCTSPDDMLAQPWP